MRYVTKDQYEREVTDWNNIQNTKRNMHINGRTPTIVELQSNYLLDNIVVQLPTKEVRSGQGRPLGVLE